MNGVILGRIWSPENKIFDGLSNIEISVLSCPGVNIISIFLLMSFNLPSSSSISGSEIFPANFGVFI